MVESNTATAREGDESHAAEGSAEQYLTFTLGGEDYGVDILRVQEIRGWNEVRAIPNTPDYVKGVLNLRGTIVPIIDMRTRFKLEQIEYTPVTVIIVLAVEGSNGRRVMGIVVDGVSDVLDVVPERIKEVPDFGTKINTRFIGGMVMEGERMVILLDSDKLLDPDELALLEAIDQP